jgi:hypothetical protein
MAKWPQGSVRVRSGLKAGKFVIDVVSVRFFFTLCWKSCEIKGVQAKKCLSGDCGSKN